MKLTIKTLVKNNHAILQTLGRITTGLYNSANYHRQTMWKNTNKIPNYYDQYKIFKNDRLSRLLNSQVAQQTLRELDQAYKSWYSLRKKDPHANPPRYRKPKTPVSIWWPPDSFRIIDNGKIRLSVANLNIGQRYIFINVIPNNRYDISKLNVTMINIVFKNSDIYACLCYNVQENPPQEVKEIVAIDFGICNLVASTDTQGHQTLISGRKILSIQRYFNKKVGYLQSKLKKQRSTKAIRRLKEKQSRQIKHLLHIASKRIMQHSKGNGSTLVVGDLNGLRKSRSKKTTIENGEIKKKRTCNKKEGQKIHGWSYSAFTSLLEYKCKLQGVNVIKVSERYTSQTCPSCGAVKKKNRSKRGFYKCDCGYRSNADINGSKNILLNWARKNVSPISFDIGVVVRGVDLSTYKFDASNLYGQKISIALA
jgi:putative transposase